MESAIQELQLAGFLMGDNLFAIDIMRIKEIVIPQKLAGFPLQNSSLDGMINLRGQVIPVMNLRARFGMPPRPGGPGKLTLDKLLGLPVWAQPRPKPVLWLAIDDGSGPRLLTTGQVYAARSVLDRAQDRGYRLGLPSGGAAEQAAVGAIWRNDPAAVARASARYSPPMQLIGKLYRSGAGWTADWTFVDSGRVLATRSVSDGDARRAIASGADVAADALVQRYAKVPPSEPAGTYRVAFTGLRNAEDYLRVSAMLQKMPVVRRIAPARADGQRVEFDLDLLTGMAGFQRMLGADAPVVAVEGVPMEYRIR